MTKKLIVLLGLTVCAGICLAQTGRITITGDVRVNEMVEKHVELNSKVKTIQGYRVQIASFSGNNSKSNAFNLRERFLIDYPETQVYIVFD